MKTNKTIDSSGKIEVKYPIQNDSSAIMSVIINPLTEKVVWNYAYKNGEKFCYGYDIVKIKHGISN